MKSNYLKVVFACCLLFFVGQLSAQVDSVGAYILENQVDIPVTSVKDQASSGTCWSFAATSFVEAEILKESGQTLDLSEMYFVRMAYPQKAALYVRYHGQANFGPGGQAHDVMDVIRANGFVPEEVFDGKTIGEEQHIHGEMDAVAKAYLDAVIKNRNRKLSPVWFDAFQGIMDAYLGKIPTSFTIDNVDYTPVSYKEAVDFNPDEYVEFTSYQYKPYNEKILLEIPDNWSDALYYNVNLEDLMEIMHSAFEKGYTVCWDGDVSDKGFSYRNGLALLPDLVPLNMDDSERARWETLTNKERNKELYSFETVVTEMEVSPELRQQHFDNYQTTDDHLMHLTGFSKDQNGTNFYKTKNSWNTSNDYEGYLYMSEAYVRLNTVAIMVHKDAVPQKIRKSLGIK